MPKTVAEFLTMLATKAGVKIDDEKIKPLLAAPELAGVTIPDELVTPIDNGLLSIASARNNHPDLKNHYFSQAYDGLDKELDRFVEEAGVPEEVKTEIKAEKSSTKRAVLIANKIRELEQKKANSGQGEKAELQKQIDSLHAELRTEKEGIKKIRQEYEQKLKDKDMAYNLRNVLTKYKTIYDELPVQVKDITLKALIENELQADSAVLSVDESGQLIIRKKDGSNLFGEDNRVFTPETWLDKTMSRNKILVVNDPNQNQNSNNSNSGGGNSGANNMRHPQNNNGQNQNQNNNNGSGSGKAASGVLKELLANAEKDINTSNTNMGR